jgi:hydroxypyruvate isomerase
MRNRLSANLGLMWPSLPLLKRIESAAAAGFSAIELHWPYETSAKSVRQLCQDHGLRLLSVNTPQGNLSLGDTGLAGQVGREAEFRAAFELSLDWALQSGAGLIHVLPGQASASQPEAARDVFLENLRWAADLADQHQITLLLEALNRRDKPGYFYHQQAQSDAIRQAAAKDNIKLMFDVYHVGLGEGDVLNKLQHYLPVIGHIQIAAVPSRCEPDEGEIRYEVVFERLKALGYDGWIGCEYNPRADTDHGLRWVQAMGL